MASYWYLLLVVCIQLSYGLETNRSHQSKCRKMCHKEEDWKKTLANGVDQREHERIRKCIRKCRNQRTRQRQKTKDGTKYVRVDPDAFVIRNKIADRVTGGFTQDTSGGRTSQEVMCYHDVHMVTQIIFIGEQQIEIVYETKTLRCSAV